jgi:hypothetical protein
LDTDACDGIVKTSTTDIITDRITIKGGRGLSTSGYPVNGVIIEWNYDFLLASMGQESPANAAARVSEYCDAYSQ